MNLWQQLDRASGRGDGGEVGVAGGGLRFHAPRVLIALALALITYALFPASPAVDFPLLEVGSVAPDNVIAPFAYDVRKTDAELTRERDDMARSVVPVFAYSAAALDSARTALRSFSDAVSEAARSTASDPERAAAVVAAGAQQRVQLTPQEAAYLLVPARRSA